MAGRASEPSGTPLAVSIRHRDGSPPDLKWRLMTRLLGMGRFKSSSLSWQRLRRRHRSGHSKERGRLARGCPQKNLLRVTWLGEKIKPKFKAPRSCSAVALCGTSFSDEQGLPLFSGVEPCRRSTAPNSPFSVVIIPRRHAQSSEWGHRRIFPKSYAKDLRLAQTPART